MLIELTTKLVLIGDVAVGKTSIAKKYVHNEHTIDHVITIGVDYFVKNITINNNKNKYNIRLQLWDTAGMEKFRSITKMYYMGSSYVLIIFDMSNMDSFLNATTSWYQNIINTIQNPHIIYIGNKCDKSTKKILDAINLWLYQNNNIIFFKTSINDTSTLNNVFDYIIDNIIHHYNNNTLPFGTTIKNDSITNSNDTSNDNSKTNCLC